MKLICLEEHVLDPATAKASMPAALKAAPFLPGWGSTVTDGRNPDHSRPQVIANADSTRKGMDWEQERLADMDAAGVDMQVLSLGGFPQFAPPEQELPLAEQGYITIAFDAAYQGGSSGTPRYTDKPQNRIEDIRAAADFITQYAGADASRLGLLGVCGGGGYSIKAAQTDKRFRSIATISMFNTGDARRNGYMRSQKDSIQERLAKAAEARALEARTGEVQYTPEFGAGMTSEQVAAIKVDLYRQGYEYYADTHYHPNSKTNSTVSSLADLMDST